MVIKHGSLGYEFKFVLCIMVNTKLNSIYFCDIDSFKDFVSFEYPNHDISSYISFCDKEINDVRNWIDMGKPYKEEWTSKYLYLGIIGSDVLISRSASVLEQKMYEKFEDSRRIKDNFICKIECYGWVVNSIKETGVTKISYYTITDDENANIYPIYVYKDYIILGNGNKDKPTIITSKYFLYNAGKKTDE